MEKTQLLTHYYHRDIAVCCAGRICWKSALGKLPSSVLGKAVLEALPYAKKDAEGSCLLLGAIELSCTARAGGWRGCPCCRNLVLGKIIHSEETCRVEYIGTRKRRPSSCNMSSVPRQSLTCQLSGTQLILFRANKGNLKLKGNQLINGIQRKV